MQAYLVTIACKFGRDRVICLGEEAIFLPAQKCPYHVTFDLDLDLEHIVDAGSHGDHPVQVWSRCSHLPRRRSDFPASTNVPLTLSTPWMHPDLESIMCKFGRDLAIYVREEAICAKVYRQTDRQTDGQTTDAAPLH